MISAASLHDRLAGLDEIGISDKGVYRLAWTDEDAACGRWFEGQARAAGLDPVRDPAGNRWACPREEPPWWVVGSHLDSVRGGGRFDGPLGVACGFEIAAAAAQPLAVISFADEEGARFNTPTFGSKALAGRLDLPAVLERRDEDGTALGEAMRAAGVDPGCLGEAPQWLSKMRGFLEIHIDQSRGAAAAGVPFVLVEALAHRRRLEVDLHGRADHAGTTPRGERRDALAAAARLIVAADELAGDAVTATAARIEVAPNAATTIAGRVRLWLDGRASEADRLDAWIGAVQAAAGELAERSGVEISLARASTSEGRVFDAGLRAALARAAERTFGGPVPEHVCFAGHDAGVVGEFVPAAMLLVRNPSGVSHAPEEEVSLEDAAVAAEVALDALVRSP